MKLCSRVEIRRCRPLLGTFVEITAGGRKESALRSAINAAFSTIERLQCLLSVYDPASETSRINREAALRPVPVSRETFAVLRLADRLATESGGAFDPAVAPVLADWGMLPSNLRRQDPGTWRDVLLLRHRQVHFRRPLAIDLGGIAKGFAVDRAIETLREHGVASAGVNAGGDLRVFGSEPSAIHLRHPAQPQRFAHTIHLRQGALATSSPCFTERSRRGKRVSHLVDPSQGSAITGSVSVTVRARECWLADALTKVVLNAPERAEALLRQYDAEAVVLST